MSERDEVSIDIEIYEAAVLPEVLERVVSAMATLANLPIDRLMNALTAMDVLTPSVVSDMTGETARHVGVKATEGRLDVMFEKLKNHEAEGILGGASIPGIGDVLDKLAADVRVEDDGKFSRLVVSLD